jgi:hypothetical protein
LAKQEMDKPRVAQSAAELHRTLVRRWRRTLLRTGFTEQQAGGLIVAKLLYIRGSLRG